jgi:hypothetical protein
MIFDRLGTGFRSCCGIIPGGSRFLSEPASKKLQVSPPATNPDV